MDIATTEWAERLSGKASGSGACALAQSLREKATSPAVVRALMQHPDSGIRGEVAWVLYEVAHTSGDLLPLVFHGLDDSSNRVRYWCVLALKNISVDRRIEAMVRIFGLLEDDDSGVRRAAADVLQVLGSRVSSGTLRADPSALRDFAAALSADPESYGLDAKKAVVTSRVQSQLRSGYGRSWAEIADHQDWESLDNLAQVGVGIQLGHSWAQFADSITQTLPHLRPDVRCVAIRRIDELLKTTMAVVRPLSDDSDATTRKRSWLLLDMMVSEIESWRRKIPGAARDDDKAVRENCFLNLAHNIDSNIISTVLDTCQNANGVALREALAALRHMVWEASSVVMLGSRALQALSRRLDDTTLSTDIREELLSILKSYAEVFQHRDVGINWAELSTRTLADETKGDAGADSPST